MKKEVVAKIIAVLSLFGMSNALADTFLSTFDSFKLRHLPSLYTEIIENTYFQYIVENGRALLFNYKYNGQGYAQAYAVNAVYAKGGADNKYSEPYYVYGQMDVPNVLGGYPLLKIGERAFQGCSQITGVSIPEGVVDIAQEAFKSCKNLRTFVCASSVTNIGYDAFSGSEGVTKFVFPGNTKFTGTISATNVCDLTVPVMKVSERFTCGHVTNLVFNTFGVQKFSKDAFSGCSAVTALELRGQIESVNANSFSSALPDLEIVYVTLESSRKVRDALALANRSDVEVRVIDGEGNRIEGEGFVGDVVVSVDSEDVYYPRTVEITCPTDGAVIHYTVDGSVVTETSPVYKGPFVVSETTTVRAKAYKTDWFPSEEVSQSFTRLWHTTKTPVVTAESAAFDGASQEVRISCATEGATVYYTIDGREPGAANGRVDVGCRRRRGELPLLQGRGRDA